MDNSTMGYFDNFTTDYIGNSTTGYFDDEIHSIYTILFIFSRVYFGVACVGVLANGLAFWVLLGEKRKSTTTLLFMYLAVCDTLALICVPLTVYTLLYSHPVVYNIFWSLSYLALALSVHTTAFITFNRWLAVWKPLRVSTIMSKRRVVILNAVILLWCGLLVSTERTLKDLDCYMKA
jgi:hypothetical protein